MRPQSLSNNSVFIVSTPWIVHVGIANIHVVSLGRTQWKDTAQSLLSMSSEYWKKQVMTLNFTAQKDLQDKYNLQWEAEALKYLGITDKRPFRIITSRLWAIIFKDKIRYA